MKLAPFIVKNIIAPHGITDISHALMTNRNKELFLINLFNVGFVETIVTPLNLSNQYDILFFIATIIHFKNDFSNIKIKNLILPRYVSSALFIIACLFINKIIPYNLGYDMLLGYMTIIHVPNHYRENWFHIKKDLILNFLIIMFTIAFFNGISDSFPDLMDSLYTINAGKAIIISHVFYQEKYIKNNKSIL